MTTFSQLVDSLVAECRRPDMLNEVIAYTNQTLREVHFEPTKGGAIMYKENFTEALIQPTVETGFGWDIPDPSTFQAMQVVKYMIRGAYPSERVPSRALAGLCDYYYRSGGHYSFAGYAGTSDMIALGYYEYPRRLIYYPLVTRPAQYAPDIGWSYNTAFTGSIDLKLAAQTFTSNWLLLRWIDVIAEGIRAKIYKRVSDTDRAKTCYSLYMTLRQGLYTSETADAGGFS